MNLGTLVLGLGLVVSVILLVFAWRNRRDEEKENTLCYFGGVILIASAIVAWPLMSSPT